jgi:hypothetical protein
LLNCTFICGGKVVWQRVKCWFFAKRYLKRALAFSEHQLLMCQHQLLAAQSVVLKNDDTKAKNINSVVSLTSYSTRILTLHYTLYSLLNQTVKPKFIIVWLAHGEVLTDELKALEPHIIFKWCADLRSYKKLIPTLSLQLGIPIITFDDDIIYPNDQIERLYNTHLKFPNNVICHRAHKITFTQNGDIAPYADWEFDSTEQRPSHQLMPIGIGGVLYPVNCFVEDVLNIKLFTQLCPTADDIWFKFMALKKGYKTKLVTNPRPYKNYLHVVGSQDQSLWESNKIDNDVQLTRVISDDSEILSMLRQ